MLNFNFIERKVKLIQEDLSNLEPLAQVSFDEVAHDPVKSGAMERYLERIVTRAIDINRHCIAEIGQGNEAVRTSEDTFLRMADLKILPHEFAKDIAPSAGLRNVLVHEYDGIDRERLYDSAGQALAQYARYCDFILKFLDRANQSK